MDPIDKKSSEFRALETYTHGTHGKTHHFNCGVEAAFRIERLAPLNLNSRLTHIMSHREGEAARWDKSGFNDLADGERLLLWHGEHENIIARFLQDLSVCPGSRATNYAGMYIDCAVRKLSIQSSIGILSQGLRIAPPEGEVSRSLLWTVINCLHCSSGIRVRAVFFFVFFFVNTTFLSDTCSERVSKTLVSYLGYIMTAIL